MVGKVNDIGACGQVGDFTDGANQTAGGLGWTVLEQQCGAPDALRSDDAICDKGMCHTDYYPLLKTWI
jgi:hypothetical protein